MPVYTYTTFDDPLASGGDGTHAAGINDTGHIVGTYADASGVHGFLLSGGSYTPLDAPLAPQHTLSSGINRAGQIGGRYLHKPIRHPGLHCLRFHKTVYTTHGHPLPTH